MILSFRCPPRLREKIEKLIESGSYEDLSSFCTSAIENLLLLEERIPQSQRERVPTKGPKTAPARQPRDKATHSFSEPAVSPSVASSEPAQVIRPFRRNSQRLIKAQKCPSLCLLRWPTCLR